MKGKHSSLCAAAIILVFAAVCLGADPASYNNKGIEYLDKGDYVSAILYLEEAVKSEPASAQIKRNLAVAYSNYGVKLLNEDKGELAIEKFASARGLFPEDQVFRSNAAKAYNQLAIKALEEENFVVAENNMYAALRLQPEEQTIRRNLSVCLTNYGAQYYDKKEFEMARGKFNDAITFDETNANAHAFLGNIYYYDQQLEKALVSYQNSLKYNPDMEFAKQRVEALKKEITVEGRLANKDNSIFKIRYNSGDENFDLSTVEASLWETYYAVGSMFQYYPRHSVIVIIYSPKDFKEVRDTPNWVAGLYDGKIRIPYPEDMEMAEMKKILRHEYTHLVVHDVAKGKCINWLNEGLARLMEYSGGGGEGPDYSLLKKAIKEDKIYALDELGKNFIYTKDPKRAAVAYQQSAALVAYIIDQFGFYKVRNMLNLYAEGKTTEEILKGEFYQEPDAFITDWKEYIRINIPGN